MRYADLAYAHIQNKVEDPTRAQVMDRRAEAAGFSNTPDYIDNVQGRSDTKSFEASGGRTCWVNEGERVYGWNHSQDPEQSTVIPARKAGKEFQSHKQNEADNLNVPSIPERGALSEQERTVDPAQLKTASQQFDTAPNQARLSPESQTTSSQAAQTPDLTKVDLPKYAEAEHGYTAKSHASGMYLEKDGERLRTQQDSEGSWSYENPKKDNDSGTITDFATQRGGSEAGIADYLNRNPDEVRKAQEVQKTAEDTRAKAAEQAATRTPDGRGE